MNSTLSIKETAGALWERHAFIGELINLSGITSNWNVVETAPESLHILDKNSTPFEFVKPGSIIALIAQVDTGYVPLFQTALEEENPYKVHSLFDKLSDKINATSASLNQVIEEEVDTIIDISYADQPVMSNIVLDKQLRFNLVAIDFNLGHIDQSKIKITCYNRTKKEASYQTVIAICQPKLSYLEKVAMRDSPVSESEIKLNFSPRSSFIDDVVHDAEDGAQDVANVVGNIAAGAGQVIANAAQDVGLNAEAAEVLATAAETAVDAEGAADVIAATALLTAGGSNIMDYQSEASNLGELHSEASVDELINTRNTLLTKNKTS